MFLVRRGKMIIEFRDHRVTLQAGELCVVPHSVEHRTMSNGESEVLVFEPAETRNTGNILDEKIYSAKRSCDMTELKSPLLASKSLRRNKALFE